MAESAISYLLPSGRRPLERASRREHLHQALRCNPTAQPHDDAPHLDLGASSRFGCCLPARQARYERHEGRAFLARLRQLSCAPSRRLPKSC
jgi:hypothetical protein